MLASGRFVFRVRTRFLQSLFGRGLRLRAVVTRATYRETEIAGVEFREILVGDRLASRLLQVGVELLNDGVLFLHER